MLEIFNNLPQKMQLPRWNEKYQRVERRHFERLFPVFLQIDFQFPLRASQ